MPDITIGGLGSLTTPAAADVVEAEKASAASSGKVTFAQLVSAGVVGTYLDTLSDLDGETPITAPHPTLDFFVGFGLGGPAGDGFWTLAWEDGLNRLAVSCANVPQFKIDMAFGSAASLNSTSSTTLAGASNSTVPTSLATKTYRDRVPYSVTGVTMSGAETLVQATHSGYVLERDPNGSDRIITLWASPTVGEQVAIYHVGSANTLTVNASGGTLVKSVTFGQAWNFVFNGTVWRAL